MTDLEKTKDVVGLRIYHDRSDGSFVLDIPDCMKSSDYILSTDEMILCAIYHKIETQDIEWLQSLLDEYQDFAIELGVGRMLQ